MTIPTFISGQVLTASELNSALIDTAQEGVVETQANANIFTVPQTFDAPIIQTPGQGANNETPFAQYGDLFSDAIASGLTTTTSATLSGTLTAGVAYVIGQRVPYAGSTYTVAASSTSYLDLSNTGALTVTTTSGTVTANSLRLWSVTSSATAITAVSQIAATSLHIDSIGNLTIPGTAAIAPATASNQAVALGQAQADFAAINGSASEVFAVAPATASNQAVNLGQYQALGIATNCLAALVATANILTSANAGQFVVFFGTSAGTVTLPLSNSSAKGTIKLVISNQGGGPLTIVTQGGNAVDLDVPILQTGQQAILWNDGGSVWRTLVQSSGTTQPFVVGNATASNQAVNLGQSDSRYQRSNLAVSSTTTAGAITVTASQLAGGYFSDGATQTASFTVTTDTATNILAAMPNAVVGTAFKWRFINNDQSSTGYAGTLAGGTGVTIGTILPNPAVPKGGYEDYIFTFTAIGATPTLTVEAVGGNSAALL